MRTPSDCMTCARSVVGSIWSDDSAAPLQDHGKVLALLNQLLSSVASSPTSPQTQRDRLHQLAVVVAERYKGCGHSAPQPLAHTFFLLLDIMTFFDHYHSKRSDQALEVSTLVQIRHAAKL